MVRRAPQRHGARADLAAIAPLALAMAGCDPIIDISGAYFPAWFACMVGGVALVWGAHRLLAKLGVMPWVGPKLLMLFCGYLSAVLLLWLVIFAK